MRLSEKSKSPRVTARSDKLWPIIQIQAATGQDGFAMLFARLMCILMPDRLRYGNRWTESHRSCGCGIDSHDSDGYFFNCYLTDCQNVHTSHYESTVNSLSFCSGFLSRRDAFRWALQRANGCHNPVWIIIYLVCNESYLLRVWQE